MRCKFCKSESDVTNLYEGIQDAGMIITCESCAKKEGVPLIRKPTEAQIERTTDRRTVRERMEKMSGVREATEISQEQMQVQGNLARLRMPGKKEHHEDLFDDYYWRLNMGRRRKKLSINQLAKAMQMESSLIEEIEKGKIPEDFESIFLQLESFLGIKLLKHHKPQLIITRSEPEEEKMILEQVKERMKNPKKGREEMPEDLEEPETPQERKEKLERISRGEIDFSKKEDIESLTLSDLAELKRKRDKKDHRKKVKIKTDAMIGDDIELDED